MTALIRLSHERGLKIKELALLAQEKEHLEHRLSFMGKHIDRDLLEVQVRSVLGYVHPSEILIFTPLE